MLRSLSVKLTLWASLVAVLGMASATYLSWSAARAEFLDLQLGGADRQLTASVAAAQQIFGLQFPGPWRLVRLENAAPIELFNGNGLDAAYRTTETLDHALYKGEVDPASVQVARAADAIATGSQAQAAGASEQAATLEEVASSLQELASMATRNTGNAGEARNPGSTEPRRPVCG